MPFSVIDVIESYQIEQLGTKSKFWFYRDLEAKQNSEKSLCKIGRLGTGENWAEKFSSELAQFLEIPCVEYDLALSPSGDKAVTCPSFVDQGGSLIHANELLSKVFDKYPSQNAFQSRQYKISTSFAFLKSLEDHISPPKGHNSTLGIETNSISEIFLSYIMFDCLIGNQDRHDENWGIVVYMTKSEVKYYLAPTYDHASCLACRLSDDQRHKRLTSKDVGYQVESFASKAKTPFYDNEGRKRLKTLDCLKQAIIISKSDLFVNQCIDKICSITERDLRSIFNQFPRDYITDIEIEFSIRLIEENKRRISELRVDV